ncbi:hypothetical protein [Pseudomonas phoenicis]|uniref:hypothetical protein n=1 Tax=unclassified Pseudomonas TaxID=196821 RepID=UPI00399EEB0C
MTRQTKEQFITEMKKKPQTLDWDVVLAFDRNKTNYLLLQDYISRFGADSLFPAVDSSIAPVAGTTHQLHGLQLDKPRLSFENAVITESRARCLMRTVGGRTIETSRPQGTTRDEVKRLGIADGLVGPILTMTIHLRNAPGSVGSAGKVELDLAGNGAADFKLSGVETEFERVKLGEHLKQEIAKWNDAQKKFELSELRQNAEDALQPTSFRVLTRPAAGATSRTAEDYGDGEVLVFVGLDEREGSLPSNNTQIPYLLPQGYSSNLIISYEQYYNRMLMPRLISVLDEYGAEYRVEQNGAFSKYVITAGNLVVPSVPLDPNDPWSYRFSCFRTQLPFDGMTIGIVDNAVALSWAGKSPSIDGGTLYYDRSGDKTLSYDGQFSSTWNLVQAFQASLQKDDDSNRTLLAIESVERSLTSGYELHSGSGDSKCKTHFIKSIDEHFENWCRPRIGFLQEKFESTHQTIDAFRLNSLLFRNEAVVMPQDVDMPGDLTILGDISMPAHQLSESEVTVSAGATHAFSVQPVGVKPTWTVSDPLDTNTARGISPTSVGSIDADGLYTAPTAASFGFTSKRVVVTATGDGWSSQALVNLVAAPVSVFPLVNVVNLSSAEDPGYLVWAASTSAAALTGNITGNAGGTLTKADDPDVQSAWRYKAPAEFPSDGTSKLEKVLRVDRVEVSQGGGQAAVCEMILTKTPSLEYFFKYEAVRDGVQFSFWYTDDDNLDIELPNEDVEWVLVCGHGVLDDQGKYTPSTTAADHYVVVAAIDLMGGRITLWNFKILPLPLVAAATAGEFK